MVTPPEFYYEIHPKVKNIKEILSDICNMKKETDRLKNAIENPDPNITEFCHPTDIGSEAEKKALLFDASIPAISAIRFSIGGYYRGYETYTFTLHEDCIYRDFEHSHFPRPSNLPNGMKVPFTKAELLDGIKKLHIGQWKTNYSNLDMLDGTQWNITIEFSDSHKTFESCGFNNYPFNFKELLRLLHVNVY